MFQYDEFSDFLTLVGQFRNTDEQCIFYIEDREGEGRLQGKRHVNYAAG